MDVCECGCVHGCAHALVHVCVAGAIHSSGPLTNACLPPERHGFVFSRKVSTVPAPALAHPAHLSVDSSAAVLVSSSPARVATSDMRSPTAARCTSTSVHKPIARRDSKAGDDGASGLILTQCAGAERSRLADEYSALMMGNEMQA